MELDECLGEVGRAVQRTTTIADMLLLFTMTNKVKIGVGAIDPCPIAQNTIVACLRIYSFDKRPPKQVFEGRHLMHQA